jgi:heme-degrading monooxygenase HmoA
MYAALTTLSVSPGMWTQMAKSTDQLFAEMKSFKGFKQATFFGDNDAGRYYSLILWNSKQDAEAAQAITAPRV